MHFAEKSHQFQQRKTIVHDFTHYIKQSKFPEALYRYLNVESQLVGRWLFIGEPKLEYQTPLFKTRNVIVFPNWSKGKLGVSNELGLRRVD